MPGENLNKNFHWKSKLDELENIPCGVLHKEQAWNKLHERLQEKKRNKKVIGYWIAAACLLFAFITVMVNRHKNNLDSPAPVMSVQGEKPPVSPLVNAEQKKNGNSDLTTKNKTIDPPSLIGRADHRVITQPLVTKTFLRDTTNSPLITDAATKSLQIPDANSNATVFPAKQKLKVVHINELENPVIGSSPDMVRNTDKYSFKLMHPDEEVFASPIANNQSRGFIIITKPSSN